MVRRKGCRRLCRSISLCADDPVSLHDDDASDLYAAEAVRLQADDSVSSALAVTSCLCADDSISSVLVNRNTGKVVLARKVKK